MLRRKDLAIVKETNLYDIRIRNFSISQGKKNPGTDRHSVQSFLNQVKTAKEMKMDR